MHVADADRAFVEMVRVTRSGGRLSVFDFDWEPQGSRQAVARCGRGHICRERSPEEPPFGRWATMIRNGRFATLDSINALTYII